jgi:hypothetical protein
LSSGRHDERLLLEIKKRPVTTAGQGAFQSSDTGGWTHPVSVSLAHAAKRFVGKC